MADRAVPLYRQVGIAGAELQRVLADEPLERSPLIRAIPHGLADRGFRQHGAGERLALGVDLREQRNGLLLSERPSGLRIELGRVALDLIECCISAIISAAEVSIMNASTNLRRACAQQPISITPPSDRARCSRCSPASSDRDRHAARPAGPRGSRSRDVLGAHRHRPTPDHRDRGVASTFQRRARVAHAT
jgi:hypothetical protein